MSKKEMTINIILGVMAPPLKKQLRPFDFVPAKEIAFLQKISDSISLLYFQDIISESQKIKCFKKLINKIDKTIVKFSKAEIDKHSVGSDSVLQTEAQR